MLIYQCMEYKQEELETIVHQRNHDLIAIMETWWNELHGWSAAIGGYRLFRRDWQGKRGGGVALCVKECFCQSRSATMSDRHSVLTPLFSEGERKGVGRGTQSLGKKANTAVIKLTPIKTNTCKYTETKI